MDPILAIDIGGTKLAAGIVVGEDLVRSRRTPTEGADGEALFATLTALAAEVVDEHVADGGRPPTVVGVGCGGPMEPDGLTVSPLNIPQWRAFPLRDRLAERFGLPVRVDNDAKALALAEGWLGAARGCDDYVRDGGVDGRRWRVRGRRATARRRLVERRPHRPRGGGARGPAVSLRLAGLPRGRDVGHEHRRDHRASRRRGHPRGDRPHGAAGGTRAIGWFVVALDLRLACVAGSVALGFGEPFFAAANDELEAVANIDYARGARVVPAGLGRGGAAARRRGRRPAGCGLACGA